MQRALPAPRALSLSGLRVPAIAIVGGISLVGLLLRALQLNSTSLWIDEIGQALAVSQPLPEMVATIRSHAAAAPLDYFGTWLTVRLVDEPTIGPRLWPLLVGSAAIPLAYAAGTAWFGQRAGILAALLLTVSPFHVFYSTEGRFYALAVTVALTYLWALRKGSPVMIGLTAMAGLLTVYSFGILWLAGMLWRRERNVVIAHVLAAIPASLWFVYADASAPFLPWSPGSLPQATIKALAELTGGGLLLGLLIAPLLIALAMLGLRRQREAWPLAAAAAALIPLMWLAATRSGYFWDARHVILVLPLLILLAAAAGRWKSTAVIAGLLLVGTLTSTMDDRRENWRALAADSTLQGMAMICTTADRVTAVQMGLGWYAPDLTARVAVCTGPGVHFPLDHQAPAGESVRYGGRLWLVTS